MTSQRRTALIFPHFPFTLRVMLVLRGVPTTKNLYYSRCLKPANTYLL